MWQALARTTATVTLAALAICALAQPAWSTDDSVPAAAAAPVRRGAPTWEFVPTAEHARRATETGRCSRRCALAPRWRFDVVIPLWIPGVSGSFASGGVTIEADKSVSNALDDAVTGIGDFLSDLGDLDDLVIDDPFAVESDLKFGFLGSIQAHKGKWTIGLDGFGVNLGSSVNYKLTDGTVVNASFWTLMLRGTGKYEWLRRPVRMPWCGTGCFRARAVAGARYYGAGFKATLPFDVKLEDSVEWVDPIVGLDLALDLSRKFRLRVEGDIGGFGIGSDFAWWLIFGVDWHFARQWTLMLAYAHLDVDYGSAADFAWNLHLQGPSLGIQFSF